MEAPEFEQTIRDLQARVESLERRSAHASASRRRPRVDLGLIQALTELIERSDDSASPAGAVTYAGVAELGDERLAWQMVHSLPDLLALDETSLARLLAAIASPVRIRILREVAAGPLEAHELQKRLGEPSAGQLYHHLRLLLATGLLTQPRRSVYELPAHTAVPIAVLLACAHDLATPDPGAADAP